MLQAVAAPTHRTRAGPAPDVGRAAARGPVGSPEPASAVRQSRRWPEGTGRRWGWKRGESRAGARAIRWDAETGRQHPACARLGKAAPALTCASTYSETIESHWERTV